MWSYFRFRMMRRAPAFNTDCRACRLAPLSYWLSHDYLCVVFFTVLSSLSFLMSYRPTVLVTIGGQLRLFWQPSTLYVSHMGIIFVCTCIVENKIFF